MFPHGDIFPSSTKNCRRPDASAPATVILSAPVPLITEPSLANFEPWHGQSKPLSVSFDDATQMSADRGDARSTLFPSLYDSHDATGGYDRLPGSQRRRERDLEFFGGRRKHGSFRQSHGAKEIQKAAPLPPTTKRQGQGNPAVASLRDRGASGQRLSSASHRSSCGPPLGLKPHSLHGDGIGRATLHTKRAANAAVFVFENRRVVFQISVITQIEMSRNSAISAVWFQMRREEQFSGTASGRHRRSRRREYSGCRQRPASRRNRGSAKLRASPRLFRGIFPPAPLGLASALQALAAESSTRRIRS